MRDGCAYSFLLEIALKGLGSPSLLMPPISFNNIIGTIIHKIFQEVNNGGLDTDEDTLIKKWKELCTQKQSELREEYPTLRNIEIGDYDAMFETIYIAQRMRSQAAFQKDSAGKSIDRPNEHFLKLDGLLKGSIDRIKASGDGVEVIDYKTGKIFDDNGNVKKEYVAQLNLYTYMLMEKESAKVTGLTIIDRSGAEVPVDFYPERKDDVLNAIRSFLKKINGIIKSSIYDDLRAPSKENCNFCACQHICMKRVQNPESPFHIIRGFVNKVWNKDQISIKTNDNKEILIAKLSPLDINGLDSLPGRELIFVNLLQIQEDAQYNRCEKTAIYEIG